MILFLIGLIGFLGVHLIHALAPGFRAGVISKLGANGWKGVFSLLSLIFFALLVIGYPAAQLATIYFAEPPTGLKHINSLLIQIALVLMVAGSLPRGFIQKTLKHPQLVGVKLWAAGHLLVNWDLTSFIFFGAFLAWAVFVRISIKKRAVPVTKEPSMIWDLVAVIAGLAISAWLIIGGHAALFGVPPIPMSS